MNSYTELYVIMNIHIFQDCFFRNLDTIGQHLLQDKKVLLNLVDM